MRIAACMLLCCCFAAGQEPLTLQQAEETARRNSPQIEAARLAAEAAGYQPAQARSALLPQLSGGFSGIGALNSGRQSAGALSSPIMISRVAFGANLTQLISDFGRTRLLAESAVARARAEEANALGAAAVTLLQVRQAFFNALRAQNVLIVAEQTVRARQTVVDQVQALADAKLKSGLDLSFAQVNLSEAKLLQVAATNDREAAMADLSNAMGLPRPTQFTLQNPLIGPDGLESRPDLLEEALRNRPDLEGRRQEVAAAERFAKAEDKLSRPVISGVGTAGYAPAHTTLIARDEYVAGGVTVNLPILNGGAFKARQAEAALRARAFGQRLRELENRIARDVNVTQLNMRTALQRIQLTGELVSQSTLALDLAQSRYDLGLSSIVELSQAQLSKLQAEIQSATARFEYELQHSVLEFQVGRLR